MTQKLKPVPLRSVPRLPLRQAIQMIEANAIEGMSHFVLFATFPAVTCVWRLTSDKAAGSGAPVARRRFSSGAEPKALPMAINAVRIMARGFLAEKIELSPNSPTL